MLLSLAILVFIAYSALGWTLFFMQNKFMYKPVREMPYTPDELGLNFEDVLFKTEDGLELNGWFVPADNTQTTVLFCHGNGGNLMFYLDSINFLRSLNLNCFIFDYRGFGNSAGRTTEQGTYLDAEAAYNWLTKQKHISPDNIIIFGRSLGGSIAAYLAGKVRARALVLESSFTSYVDIGREFYPYMPVKWFAKFSYNTIDYVRMVTCPVMVVHSQNDELIPFMFGQELYAAANDPKEFVQIYGSHDDGFLYSSEIYTMSWNKWLRFLDNYQAQTARHQAS